MSWNSVVKMCLTFCHQQSESFQKKEKGNKFTVEQRTFKLNNQHPVYNLQELLQKEYNWLSSNFTADLTQSWLSCNLWRDWVRAGRSFS